MAEAEEAAEAAEAAERPSVRAWRPALGVLDGKAGYASASGGVDASGADPEAAGVLAAAPAVRAGPEDAAVEDGRRVVEGPGSRAGPEVVPGTALDAALAGWTTRVPTGRLNAFLGELQSATPHPLRGGRQPRILFATQAQTAPPRIVIFTTGFLDAGYRRFIERRLREDFGFAGSPIQISVRAREKRQRR